MSLWLWTLLFAIESAFNYWVLAGNGAKWIEGWKSFFLIGWIALDWNAEQIRLYILIIWIASFIFFVIGLFIPAIRMEAYMY